MQTYSITGYLEKFDPVALADLRDAYDRDELARALAGDIASAKAFCRKYELDPRGKKFPAIVWALVFAVVNG